VCGKGEGRLVLWRGKTAWVVVSREQKPESIHLETQVHVHTSARATSPTIRTERSSILLPCRLPDFSDQRPIPSERVGLVQHQVLALVSTSCDRSATLSPICQVAKYSERCDCFMRALHDSATIPTTSPSTSLELIITPPIAKQH
jgi:hypothetical protein